MIYFVIAVVLNDVSDDVPVPELFRDNVAQNAGDYGNSNPGKEDPDET